MIERRPDATPWWPSFAGSLAIVVAMFVLYALLPFDGDHRWIGAVVGVVALAASGPFTIRRVSAVLSADRPVLVAAEAVMLLLTVLITGFSALYLSINHDGNQFAGLDTRIDAVYFTVSTLSTVGFGDITATAQLSRVIVTLQIVFNLSILALAVRMITSAAGHRIRQGS